MDETLDRRVAVRVLRPEHPHAAELRAVASRAALIEDARLVRVLDVGEQAGATFVVTEYVEGESLPHCLERRALSTTESCRIVAQTALALDRASQRGLSHQVLNPSHLVIRSDGSIKVSGLAIDAAANGSAGFSATGAARVDARSLISLLYLCLSGHWPGLVPVAGLKSAPRTATGPAPILQLNPDVPPDLADLIDGCLDGDLMESPGPASPQDVVAALHPMLSGNASDAVLRLPGSPSAPARNGSTPSTRAAEAMVTSMQADRQAARKPAASKPPQAPQAQAAPTAPPALPTFPDPASPAAPAASAPAAAAAAVPAEAIPTAELPEPVPAFGAGSEPAFGAGSGEQEPDDDSILSFPPFESYRQGKPAPRPAPSHSVRRFILAVVGVLVLSLVFAAFALSDVLGGLLPSNPQFPGGAPVSVASQTTAPSRAPSTAAPAPTGTSGASPSPSPSATATSTGTAPVIAGAQALDPEGDGQENNAKLDNLDDGDADTTWRTDGYGSAQFGGLKKGLGVALQLKAPAQVTSVIVHAEGSGGSLELRATDDPTQPGTVVATAAFSNGVATLTPTSPIQVRKYLVIWCTDLPQLSGSKYRLDISEVELR